MVDLGIDRIIDGLAGNLDGLFGKATSEVRDQFAGVDFGGATDSLALPQGGTLTDPFARVRFGMQQSNGGGTTGGGSAFPNPFAGFDRALQRVRDGQAQAAQSPTQRTGPADEYTNGDGSGDASTAQWRPLIEEAAREYGISDPDIVQAIMMLESQGSPTARSSQGAMGLMQVMPFHFADGEDGMDPRTNVRKGAKILAENYARYGDWDKAAAAYLGAIDRNGNISTAQDANGTDGFKYVQVFRDNLARLKAQGGTTALPNGGSLVAAARSLIGTPYVAGGLRASGGDPRKGLDCSELTAWLYKQIGVTLPWNASAQFSATQRVNAQQLQVGDLVFFHSTNPDDPDYITHVGMYVGGGKMINSQDGGVMQADLSTPYWAARVAGYGRVKR